MESMKAGFGSREDVHVLRRALGSEVVMSNEEGCQMKNREDL